MRNITIEKCNCAMISKLLLQSRFWDTKNGHVDKVNKNFVRRTLSFSSCTAVVTLSDVLCFLSLIIEGKVNLSETIRSSAFGRASTPDQLLTSYS